MKLPVNEIICGDCLEIMADWPDKCVDLVCIDPPWDAAQGIPGSSDPRGLFSEIAKEASRIAQRVVVQLGCDSEPSFLAPLALYLPYLRTCWLEYACPTYKGRLLHTGDVAYAYGTWPAAGKGHMVIPGRCISSKSDRDFIRGPRRPGKEKGGFEALPHPMPRRLEHVAWIVQWFSLHRDIVCDCVCGSGTTCVAAKMLGRNYIGIDISSEYCEIARQRLRAVDTGVSVQELKAGQIPLFEEQL